MASAPHFDEEPFDFQPVTKKPVSTMNMVLDMGKTVAFSRPFLLAIIVFLAYSLWKKSSSAPKAKKGELVNVDGRASILSNQDRASIRKSQKLTTTQAPQVTVRK